MIAPFLLSIAFGLLLGVFFVRRLKVRSRGRRLLATASLLVGGAALGACTYIACAIGITILAWLEDPNPWEVLATSVFIQAGGVWYLKRRLRVV